MESKVMKVSDLVKVRPGIVLYFELDELIVKDSGDNYQTIFHAQEICVKVKSISFYPSRQNCEIINIDFDQVNLGLDTCYDESSPTIQRVCVSQYTEHTITGNIEWGKGFYSETIVHSIKLE